MSVLLNSIPKIIITALVLLILVQMPAIMKGDDMSSHNVTKESTSAKRKETRKLLIAGGGSLPGKIFKKFKDLAGPNPKLVVIPTASKTIDKQKLSDKWKARGFPDVSVLHTRSRKEASEQSFADPIKEASAIWITGGKQHRLSEVYAGTAVETELQKLLLRGGVIGGSSAGAAIQSKVMVFGGEKVPSIGPGFDLLKGTVIDQHFLKRNRFERLIMALHKHPELVGYGIDEGAALLVVDDKMSVMGNSYVVRMRLLNGKLEVNSYGDSDIIHSGK